MLPAFPADDVSMKVQRGEAARGKIIEYYVPHQFNGLAARWIPPAERGKLIEFARIEETRDELTAVSIFRNSWIFLAPPR
jgi:hypothetical protein